MSQPTQAELDAIRAAFERAAALDALVNDTRAHLQNLRAELRKASARYFALRDKYIEAHGDHPALAMYRTNEVGAIL